MTAPHKHTGPVDIVVIGGGIAGLVAANRAADLGRRVLVLEQGSADKYLCNSRFTGGTFHVAMTDVMSGEDELVEAIARATAGFARPGLARALAADAERAVRWLQAEGLRFMKASGSAHHGWVLAPPGRVRPGLDWEGRAGDVLLRTLEANLLKRGGVVQRGTRVRALNMSGGSCAGVTAEHEGGAEVIEASHVVLCDGGFQADSELVRTYITSHPERLKQRGAGTGMGDGLRMALAVGAAVVGTDCFYGHLLSADAMSNPSLWPYPYLDSLARTGIVVDGGGARFADEGQGGVFIANAVARLPDPSSARVIFDAAIWEGPGREGLIPANPHVPAVGGTLHKAGTLRDLARLAGIDADALVASVGAHNAAIADGTPGALSPPRRADRYAPRPILEAPYYALPACAGITYTMGGVLIDEHARVLRPDDTPIEGLYAAGATTGGIEGGPLVGYVGGLIKGTVFGLRAADHAAAPARSRGRS